MTKHRRKPLNNEPSIILPIKPDTSRLSTIHVCLFGLWTELMSLRACSDSPPAAQPNREEPIMKLQQGCWEPLQHNLIASRVISSSAKRRRGLTWWHPIDLRSSVIALVSWIHLWLLISCFLLLFFCMRRRKGSCSTYWWRVPRLSLCQDQSPGIINK